MIRSRVMLNDVSPDMWNETHDTAMNEFICNGQRLLVAYLDSINGFMLEYQVPSVPLQQLTYFIKREGASNVTPNNFLEVVQYGTVMSGHIESLLRLMGGIYAPIFFENTSWPDSILELMILQKFVKVDVYITELSSLKGPPGVSQD